MVQENLRAVLHTQLIDIRKLAFLESVAWWLSWLEQLSCKQEAVGSDPTLAQCNCFCEELHCMSHGVVGGKCEYFTYVCSLGSHTNPGKILQVSYY